MKIYVQVAVLLLLAAGCYSGPASREDIVEFAVEPMPPGTARFPRQLPGAQISEGDIKSIETGLTIGGADWDADGQADGLKVTLYALSEDGRGLKARGDIYFRLYRQDLSQLDKKGKTLLEWRIPEENAASHWRNGLFGGYYFLLDYGGKVPDGDYGVLESCLKTPDGTPFFAVDTSVKLKRAF